MKVQYTGKKRDFVLSLGWLSEEFVFPTPMSIVEMIDDEAERLISECPASFRYFSENLPFTSVAVEESEDEETETVLDDGYEEGVVDVVRETPSAKRRGRKPGKR